MSLNSIVLGVLLSTASMPTVILTTSVSDSMRQQAKIALDKTKAALPNPKYWADKTVQHAKRMWLCFNNKTECSSAEINQARAWIMGVPATIASALLITGGIAITANELDKIKKETPEYRFIEFLAAELKRRGADSQAPIKQLTKQAISQMMAIDNVYGTDSNPSLYDEKDQVKDIYFNQAKKLLKKSATPVAIPLEEAGWF